MLEIAPKSIPTQIATAPLLAWFWASHMVSMRCGLVVMVCVQRQRL
jgi:hypothetical protein